MYKCRRTSVEDIHVLCFNARFYGLWGDGMGQGMAMDSEARCEENQAENMEPFMPLKPHDMKLKHTYHKT